MAECRLPKRITEEFVTCKVCLEAFKQPKILDCLHTFCLPCLLRYVDKKRLDGELPCPLCRQTTGIRQGVQGLRDNFFVLSLKEAMVSEEQIVNAQQEMVVLEVNEIHDVVEENIAPPVESPECYPRHPEKNSKWYCEHCVEFVCDLCNTHANHEKTSEEEVVSVEKAKLKKFLESVKSKVAAYRSVLSDWKGYRRELDDQEVEMQKEIGERKKEIQALLDSWHFAMTDDLKVSLQRERIEIDDIIAQVGKKFEATTELSRLGEQALKSTGHAEWLRHRRKLTFDLKENVNAFCLTQQSCFAFNTGQQNWNFDVLGSLTFSRKRVLGGKRGSPHQTIRLIGDVRRQSPISGYRYDASSIAADPHGNVVITDRQMDVIAVHSTRGDTIREICTAAIGKLICSTVTQANEVVCSRVKPSLCVFNQSKIHSRIIKDSLRKPCSLTVSKDDHLYVLDQETVFKFCATTYKKLSQVKLEYNKSSVWDKISINSHGNIYVCAHSQSCVYEFTASGKRLAQYGRLGCTGAGELYWPRGMSIDHHDNLIIADTQNDRLQLLSPRGTWTLLRAREGEGVRNPTDVTITRDGVMAVLEKTGNVRAYEYLPY